MRLSRVYVEGPIAGRRTIELTGTAANHAARVLRLRAGDPLVLFDGRGGEYRAGIETIGRNRVTVAVGQYLRADRESPVAVTLVQGISRGERMDLVMQKATELGAARIIPVATERSVVRTDKVQAQRKFEHWRSIVIAASEQCGRTRLPEIVPPLAWYDWLSKRAPEATSLLLSTRSTTPLGAALAAAATVELLVGPEGGLSPDEESAALAAGFQAVRLGPRVLRTETAAIAALAAIQQRIGDL